MPLTPVEIGVQGFASVPVVEARMLAVMSAHESQ